MANVFPRARLRLIWIGWKSAARRDKPPRRMNHRASGAAGISCFLMPLARPVPYGPNASVAKGGAVLASNPKNDCNNRPALISNPGWKTEFTRTRRRRTRDCPLGEIGDSSKPILWQNQNPLSSNHGRGRGEHVFGGGFLPSRAEAHHEHDRSRNPSRALDANRCAKRRAKWLSC